MRQPFQYGGRLTPHRPALLCAGPCLHWNRTMTDHHDPKSRPVKSSRGSGLPSAREQAAPKEPHGGKRRGESRGRGKSGDGRRSPTPVRALDRSRASPATPEPDLVEAVIDVEGVSWVVRLLGRSGGGGAGGGAPLLLIGFWEESVSHTDHDREAMVVGRTFAGLSRSSLEGAFARSVARRGQDGQPSFFADCDGRRRR